MLASYLFKMSVLSKGQVEQLDWLEGYYWLGNLLESPVVSKADWSRYHCYQIRGELLPGREAVVVGFQQILSWPILSSMADTANSSATEDQCQLLLGASLCNRER